MLTYWGKNLDKANVLKEYPRPYMMRESYVNLNGIWEYAITDYKNDYLLHNMKPDGTILVPFSPESELSGVKRQLKPGQFLWYRRKFDVGADYKKGMRVLLNFGAVDERCIIYVNRKKVKTHRGGYLPFCADITGYLKESKSEEYDLDELMSDVDGGANELVVCVADDSDTSYHSHGKQSLNAGGMFYTAQSGIWQTVWLECVPKEYLSDVKCEADADKGTIDFFMSANTAYKDKGEQRSCSIQIFEPFTDSQAGMNSKECRKKEGVFTDIKIEEQLAGRKIIRNINFYPDLAVKVNADYIEPTKKVAGKGAAAANCIFRKRVKLDKRDLKFWTPETPFLYYYKINYGEDMVTGYFALRSFTVEKDKNNIMRICLNHRPYFQKGVLDQGYWSDGLYTAASDNAYMYDILRMKEMGVNMLRKHIKIEPARWYYHCDRLGMIVWQDMVSGGNRYKFWYVTYVATFLNMFNICTKDDKYWLLSRKERAGRMEFKREMIETVKYLGRFPSIGTWVIFNEGWGQFDAQKMTAIVRKCDSSRIIDSTSGWFNQFCGDLNSHHYYYLKLKTRWDDKRATVISECGGFPLPVDNHRWGEKVFGYHKCNSKKSLEKAIHRLFSGLLKKEIDRGLSAVVYTQLSDVEEETNGLLTFDREVCKLNTLYGFFPVTRTK